MGTALQVPGQGYPKGRALSLYQSTGQYHQNAYRCVAEDIGAGDAEDRAACRCVCSSGSCHVVLLVHGVNTDMKHVSGFRVDCSLLWLG